jgi:hypothetical protein
MVHNLAAHDEIKKIRNEIRSYQKSLSLKKLNSIYHQIKLNGKRLGTASLCSIYNKATSSQLLTTVELTSPFS